MTERRMSPVAATKRSRSAIRRRFKILREDSRPVAEIKVDSPRVLAGRLVALLEDASADNPGEWSEAYTEHVINRFADRYVELCRLAPLRQKAGVQ